MAFCPICGRDHGPNRLCTEMTSETLDKTGIEQHSKSDNAQIEKLKNKLIDQC